jgi:hypothetical protein
MSLIFNSSNFISAIAAIEEETKVKQNVFYYSPSMQILNIKNAKKIVVHIWGGGGGGGGALYDNSSSGAGAGGGGAFTILDYPYYPLKNELNAEIVVGKGGSGGFYTRVGTVNNSYVPAQNGGDTIVRLKDIKGKILKEFVSYGGKGGQGNVTLAQGFVNGGNGGTNSLYQGTTGDKGLMNAYYVGGLPKGGSELQPYGDHCQMNYLSVSGSGGGANSTQYGPNHGGSFILNKGGMGGATGSVSGGGGGSTYYGKGGDGGKPNSFQGKDGESNSGAGGGGAINIRNANGSNPRFMAGGNGAHGLVVLEVYN